MSFSSVIAAANPLSGYTLLPQQNQFWKFCFAQSRSELLFTPDWPVGGISGTLSRKVPSELLNADREEASLSTAFEGRQFQSWGALTAKECSYSVATPAGTPRGTGGTMQAVEPERVQFLPLEKVIPMSLLVRSLSIFHVWIIMYLSRLRWRDWILRYFSLSQ